MTSMARNNRVAFKSEMGGDPPPVSRRRPDIEGPGISILEGSETSSPSKSEGKIFWRGVALGGTLMLMTGVGLTYLGEENKSKNFVNEVEQVVSADDVSYKAIKFEDCNNDGYPEMCLIGEDGSETRIDYIQKKIESKPASECGAE